MADSLLDNYNPLYDIHLRQYFALPHMQKHLQKMGLLESTLNLNGDEVYARHHAMMDMMLKNREAQLLRMAELRKKLDAAEKVEICRRIRTGQSPESYRRGKPSRSLSRNRAAQKGGSGGRQRRFSNSYEDRDFVQHIEERNADPDDYDTRDPYKRLSANAKRFNYLHKLDDNTLIAYKDNLKKQLQRLERFREISFGPHSVARQPPPPQASWFFRRRSVLNMRGRKTTTGNKLNASHDSRTSCPPTTRKRKDSNTRLPPINPQKGRVPTKPPAPVSLQQTTTKLPPAARKPAPTRGRPSNKRQTTTTTTTTITSVSKSPPIELPTLPSVTGHGIFTGAAAAATVAAIGTAAINMDDLISDQPEKTQSPSPPKSPVLETQKTFDRTSPTDEIHNGDLPVDILEHLANESEQVPEREETELDDHIARHIVLDSAPTDHLHGDYEDSDSEPEYAEEDRETPEETFVRREVEQVAASPSPVEPLVVQVHAEDNHASPPVTEESASVISLGSPQEVRGISPPSQIQNEQDDVKFSPVHSQNLPSPVDVPQSPPKSPAQSEHERSQPSPINSVHSSPALEQMEQHIDEPASPVMSVHSSSVAEPMESHIPTSHSPVESETRSCDASPVPEQNEVKEVLHPISAPQSPASSVHSSHTEHSALPAQTEAHQSRQSPSLSLSGSQFSEHPAEAAQQSPVLSVHSHHAVEHFEQHEAVPQSPVLSVHGSLVSDRQEDEISQSPVQSVHSSEHIDDLHSEAVPQSPIVSVHSSHHSLDHIVSAPLHDLEKEDDEAPQSPGLAISGSRQSEHETTPQSPIGSIHASEHSQQNLAASPSPNPTEQHDAETLSDTVHSNYEESAQSPVPSVPSANAYEHSEQAPNLQHSPAISIHSSHVSEHDMVDSKHVGAESIGHPSPTPENHDHLEEHSSIERPQSVHEEEPIAQVQHVELTHQVPESPAVSPIAEHFTHPVPRSPSVHTSDASENEHEEETFEVQHHAPLSQVSEVEAPTAHSPTEMDLYDPSKGNLESPILSDSEHEPVRVSGSPVVAPASPTFNEQAAEVVTGVAIADRIDLEAYHNSPTKESTSPVTANPIEIHISPEQVAEQLTSPNQVAETRGSFEEIINESADKEASHLIEEALTEAPVIIDMVQTYENRFSPTVSPREDTAIHTSEVEQFSAPVHEPEAYELTFDSADNANAMMTSIYQPSSDHEGSQVSLTEKDPETNIKMNEWDDGDTHVKETTTRSQFTDGDTHHSFSETVTVITDNGGNGVLLGSPNTTDHSAAHASADNISTDSLIIHDDREPTDQDMTQSIYQPKEEVEEKEWDEGNKHVHEVISNVEHTDESGKHFTETVTTTTTVIKSGDDLKNNNDDEGDHSDDEKSNGEGEERGYNGNVLRETITTTHDVSSAGLPEGGILVDDGDETNISSI